MPETLSKTSAPVKPGSKLVAPRSSLASRIKAAETSIATMPNRLALCLDCSGSMCGEPIEHLKVAVSEFLDFCSFADTAVALRSFPDKAKTELTAQKTILSLFTARLSASGGTPMFECLRSVQELPLTRIVVVSDGCPTDANDIGYGLASSPTISRLIDAQIPVDTVHIGQASKGEAFMRELASLTGGIFIQFDETQSLAAGLKYLTPTKRQLLLNGEVTLEEIGGRQ